MQPTTAADNRLSPAVLLIRAHLALFRVRSSLLTPLMVHLLSSLAGDLAPHPAPHFTSENAVGCSNWLLMFSTSWPSFSVLATTAAHSGSARKAPQRLSRSATLSQASM